MFASLWTNTWRSCSARESAESANAIEWRFAKAKVVPATTATTRLIALRLSNSAFRGEKATIRRGRLDRNPRFPESQSVVPRTRPLSLTAAAAVYVSGHLYAMSDEFHQTFVPKRGGRVEDVVLDTLSAVAALGFWYRHKARQLESPGPRPEDR